MGETRIENGIEYYGREYEEGYQCARCGSSATWVDCWNCGGEGDSHHDCGEDCCMCLHPENNVRCFACDGTGGRLHCISSPEWCQANPQPGRDQIESTALSSQAWADVL